MHTPQAMFLRTYPTYQENRGESTRWRERQHQFKLNSALFSAKIATMAAARIAALVLIASIPTLATPQEPSGLGLTVVVTDLTGARVPNAGVNIEPGNGTSTTSWKARQDGVANLSLKPGSYRLTVNSPGFCPEKRTVDFLDQTNLSITVQLSIGGCPSKCTPSCIEVYPGPVGGPAFDHQEIQPETTVLAETIPLNPVRDFRPLPSRRLKHR
jgi:Carboxypeptidase regulatory-like domain